MATLTDNQVDYILNDIRAHGIRLEDLQDNLLDHICILVEQRLEEEGDFEQLYASIIPSFYRNELYELEEEALFLTSLRGLHVVLSRSWFFLIIFTIVASPYVLYFLRWMFILRPGGDIREPMDVLNATMVFALYPFLTTFVLFFTPDRFDPLIPRRSTIVLGIRPFIRILPAPAI
jgi:hypothetical protein